MPITLQEISNRALAFSREWKHAESEDADAKSFLDVFFEVFGVSRRRVASFEKRVKKIDGKDGYIDLLWKGTLLIEHKSRGKDLDRAYKQRHSAPLRVAAKMDLVRQQRRPLSNSIQRQLVIAFSLFFAATGGSWAEVVGKVIGVGDGDTITVLLGNRQVKVRLTEIDAPEKRQPFGNRSKQSLSDLCLGKTATLEEQGKDRYGRTLARVTCAGTDANEAQVRRGSRSTARRICRGKSRFSALPAPERACGVRTARRRCAGCGTSSGARSGCPTRFRSPARLPSMRTRW